MEKLPKLIFSDFDGTLTDKNGHICPVFFKVLALLSEHQIPLIITSGRSLSWGQFFLTHFPVSACIMEGGGVILRELPSRAVEHQFTIDDQTLKTLDDFTSRLLNRFSSIQLSPDSLGRRSDRAIEFFDLPSSGPEIDEMKNFMMENEISFVGSNVHLNFWSGEISKAKGALKYLEEDYPSLTIDDCLFFGDALNDESMFKTFTHSVGVSNISRVLNDLSHPPKIVLEGQENYGVHGVQSYLSSLFEK